jgi:hypothetical protein
MNLEPIACGTLRATDLGIAHLLGNFPSQLRGILVATHRRDVEPFVRLDQINRDTRPCRIDHAKAETIFGIRRFGAPVARPVSSSAAIFGIKFEWQFK